MTAKTLWHKFEAIMWPMTTVVLFYVVYPRGANWPFWFFVLVVVLISFWWAGFKSRLAKFLRESLREMVVEELQGSRIAFVTWLREDAPWRGQNPFLPPHERPEN